MSKLELESERILMDLYPHMFRSGPTSGIRDTSRYRRGLQCSMMS